VITTSPSLKVGPGKYDRAGAAGRHASVETDQNAGATPGPADVAGRLLGAVLLAGVIWIGLGVGGRMLWGLGQVLTQAGRFLVHRSDHWAIIAVSAAAALYVFFFRTK
jgi:hypothetical protein